MQMLGRGLQMFGLVVVPMALIYYFSNRGRETEAKLMFGELTILALGAASFWIGHIIQGRNGE